MLDLIYTYDNISDFYESTLIATPDGNPDGLTEHLQQERPDFRGLSNKEIKDCKYGYQKGIDTLKELDLDLNMGGSRHKFIYDEFDGDDMNYDRLLDGFPPMLKRVKTHGIGSGRLINVYVAIAEPWFIKYESLLNKSYTAIQIVDMLEGLGYRVAVFCFDSTDDPNGSYRGERGVHYEVRVCLKRHEDALNKGLILNGISPWFLRYHMFSHQYTHYKPSEGMGHHVSLKIEQTKENIVINSGECLNKKDADKKINEIKKLFSADQDTLRNKQRLYLIQYSEVWKVTSTAS